MDTRYQNFDVIGYGAYATVIKAFDQEYAMPVAIKNIKFGDARNGIPWHMMREISLLRELNHVNIIRLFKVERLFSPRSCQLILEYAKYDLERYIQVHNGNINPRKLLVQILKGLYYCHSHKVMHRDLKPSNILIINGVVKLADFGLSVAFDVPNGKYTSKVATLPYRAPELLLELPYTSSIDMWAVGCTFVELVTGKPLFVVSHKDNERSATNAMMEQIVSIFGMPKETDLPGAPERCREKFNIEEPTNESRKDLASLVPGLDDDGLDLLQKMLCLNPQTRITAAHALLHPYLKEYGCTADNLLDQEINDFNDIYVEF